MYQVLYRKYRPYEFQNITGQEHITTILKNEIKTGRIAHAYLFTGPRGTGKTSCAKIMAKAVNCLSPIEGEPCNNCQICSAINNESILDIIEIDAASNNGVDNIRNLIEESSLAPVSAKYRVYIIDEVHMLSVGAFNALLKTLEEPPKHVIFILATTEIHKLPATILSRCQRFDFFRITPDKIANRLIFVAEKEGYTLDKPAAILISKISDGSLRDALSILDQCLNESTKTISVECIEKITGLTSYDYLKQIVDAISKKDIAFILNLINKLYAESKSISRLVDELILCFRDIALFKIENNISFLQIFSESNLVELERFSKFFSFDYIVSIIDTLQSSQQKFVSTLDLKTKLELDLINICNSNKFSVSNSSKVKSSQVSDINNQLDSLLRRVTTLEQKHLNLNTSKDSKIDQGMEYRELKKVNNANNESKQNIKKAIVPDIKANDLNQFNDWNKILNELKKESRSLAVSLRDSKAQIDGTNLIIYAPDSSQNMLRNSERTARLSDLITKITSVNYHVIIKKLDQTSKVEEEKKEKLNNQEKDLDLFISDLSESDVDFTIIKD